MAKKVSWTDESVAGGGNFTAFYRATVKRNDRIRLLGTPLQFFNHYDPKTKKSTRCTEDENCKFCKRGDEPKSKIGMMIAHVGYMSPEAAFSGGKWKPMLDESVPETKNKKARLGIICKWLFGGDKWVSIQTEIKRYQKEHGCSKEEAVKACMRHDWAVSCTDEQRQTLKLICMFDQPSLLKGNKAFTERYKTRKDDIENFLDAELKKLVSTTTDDDDDDDFFGDTDDDSDDFFGDEDGDDLDSEDEDSEDEDLDEDKDEDEEDDLDSEDEDSEDEDEEDDLDSEDEDGDEEEDDLDDLDAEDEEDGLDSDDEDDDDEDLDEDEDEEDDLDDLDDEDEDEDEEDDLDSDDEDDDDDLDDLDDDLDSDDEDEDEEPPAPKKAAKKAPKKSAKKSAKKTAKRK